MAYLLRFIFMFLRYLHLPEQVVTSFFLWGPRQIGKTNLLRACYPRAMFVDLLKTDNYIRYLAKPSLLREELLALQDPKPFVIIDEIQKVPLLLNEIHWLIENEGLCFGLCGSSARKLRHGHANLLGGRAIRYELYGLTFPELQDQWDLKKLLNQGYLPRHFLSTTPYELIRAYVNDYLKEEIAAEGLTRHLGSFSDFLRVAAFSDTELINFSNIASECGVSSPTVREYFQILEDTLLGCFVQAYRNKAKRKINTAPKFYFFDVGVVNFLAKRSELLLEGELVGKALENYIFHEIQAYRSYSAKYYELAYWRQGQVYEVDFILGEGAVAIEVKSSMKIDSKRLKNLRRIVETLPDLKRRIMVAQIPVARRTEDGIDILPVDIFLKQLWDGQVI